MNQLDDARGRNYLNVCHVTTGTHRAPTKSERSQKNRSSLPDWHRFVNAIMFYYFPFLRMNAAM